MLKLFPILSVAAFCRGHGEFEMFAEEIVLAAEDPRCPDATLLMHELSACLHAITGDGGQSSFSVEDVCVPRSIFAIARNMRGEAVGCGAFRPMDEKAAEIKRMYVREKSSGVGTKLLSYLEQQAFAMGYQVLRLETRLVNQGAVAFYERKGYRRIPNYGRYQDRAEAVCFEKRLDIGNNAMGAAHMPNPRNGQPLPQGSNVQTR